MSKRLIAITGWLVFAHVFYYGAMRLFTDVPFEAWQLIMPSILGIAAGFMTTRERAQS